MTVQRTAERPATVARDEAGAVHGARWFTVAFLLIGIGNYGYALVLTHLLSVDAYARFAAGQGLLLAAATVAMVSVPWVLAKALARAHSDAERADAVRFAVVTATGGGIVVSAVVAAVAAQFADPVTTLVLAAVTLLIYVTRVSSGWLQGNERMRTLAALNVGEVAGKTAAGLFLVAVVGLGDAGALAAFGAGLLPLLFWWPRLPRGGHRSWRRVTASRDLWWRSLGMARLQGLVALLIALDQVLVTVLPADRSAVAGYQAAVVLARVPLFVSTAVAIAFFPALSRRQAGSPLTAGAARMYVIVALPLAAIMATAPGVLVTAVFPAGYRSMSTYLAFTAVAGFAIGGVNLIVTFAQAADDFRVARWQAAGVLAYAAGLLAGWRLAGVPGLAAGAAAGSLTALALLAVRLRRQHGSGVLAGTQLIEPLLCAGLLAVLRPHPAVWLAVAVAVGLRATVRFLRHRTEPDATPPSGPPSGPPAGPATADGPVRPGQAVRHPAPVTAPAYPFQLADGRDESAAFWHAVAAAARQDPGRLPALLLLGQDRPDDDPARPLGLVLWELSRTGSGLAVPVAVRVRTGIWVPDRSPARPAPRPGGVSGMRWMPLPGRDRDALRPTAGPETLCTVAGDRLHLPLVVAGTPRMWTR